MLVEAESGGGKTRLLDELAAAGDSGRGVGAARTGRRPGGAAPVPGARRDRRRDHGRRCRGRAARAPAAREACWTGGEPRWPRYLSWSRCSARSSLRCWARRSTARPAPLQALAALLDALGSEDRHALVLLDDCQWADELTLELLRVWQSRHGSGEAAHVMLVAAFRSEEVAAGPPPAEAEGLVASGAVAAQGRRGAPAGGVDGGPAAAGGTGRGGAARRTAAPSWPPSCVGAWSRRAPSAAGDSGWQVDRRLMPDVQSSRRAAGLLARRLERLPAQVLELLSVGAVLGKEFDLDFACALADLSPARRRRGGTAGARQALRVGRRATEPATCSCTTSSARRCSSACRSEERRRLHQPAASTSRVTTGERVFELAYHFDAGGRGRPRAAVRARRGRARALAPRSGGRRAAVPHRRAGRRRCRRGHALSGRGAAATC